MKDTIISYLRAGLPGHAIAQAVGCTEAYVTQVKNSEEAEALLAQPELSDKDKKHNATIEKCEELALQRIHDGLGYANLGQAMKAFQILNNARRRGEALPAQVTAVQVNLTLPAAALATYTVNRKQEVIEVGGQTMVTATTKSLDQLLAERAAATSKHLTQSGKLEDAAKLLDAVQAPLRRATVQKVPLSEL